MLFVRPALVYVFPSFSLYLSHAGRSNGRLVSDKQLSSCTVGVDLDVGSGYSARLMGWRLVDPLTESQGPNVFSRMIIDFIKETRVWAKDKCLIAFSCWTRCRLMLSLANNLVLQSTVGKKIDAPFAEDVPRKGRAYTATNRSEGVIGRTSFATMPSDIFLSFHGRG